MKKEGGFPLAFMGLIFSPLAMWQAGDREGFVTFGPLPPQYAVGTCGDCQEVLRYTWWYEKVLFPLQEYSTSTKVLQHSS